MPPDAFGPWASVSGAELAARWRSLAAVAMLYGADPLMRACIAAEHDSAAAMRAWDALQGLAPLTRRKLLCAYSKLAALATPPQH